MIADTPEKIEIVRLCALKSALKLEILGMKRRGRSAYAIIKEQFNLKGNKEKVLNQFNEILEKKKHGI